MNTGLVINKSTQTIKITDSPALTRVKKVKRSVITTSRVIQETLTSSGSRFKVAMVTLTYARCGEWKSNHIRTYLDNVRKWAARGGSRVVVRGRRKKGTQSFTPFKLRYVFVAELTKRGRVHYHVLFWLPRGVSMPMADRQGWWKHGSTNSEWARKPVGYIAKYASKGVKCFDPTHSFPKGCRIHGSGGLDKTMMDWKWWILSPTWLKELLNNERFSVRKKASYWVVEKTYCYSSPYFFDFIERKLVWRGFQPIYEYHEIFPSYKYSDFDFSSSLIKFQPSEPKYVLVNRLSVLRFVEAVDNIEIKGYFDAIDRGFMICSNLKEN